jgi:general secretion pathway protein M
VAASNPRQSRALAIGLLAAVLGLGYFLLVHWWFTAPHLAIANEMADLRDQELRFRGTIAERPRIQQSLTQVREFEAANPAFLPEADFDAAASGLIQRLSQVVAAHATDPQRCTLIQKQYTRSNEKEPFDRVTIKARLRCDFEQFGPILHELETSNPVLFVDSVQIWRQTGYRTPGTNQVENYLDINFDLYGYIRKHAKAETPGKAEASGS